MVLEFDGFGRFAVGFEAQIHRAAHHQCARRVKCLKVERDRSVQCGIVKACRVLRLRAFHGIQPDQIVQLEPWLTLRGSTLLSGRSSGVHEVQ